MTTFTEGFLKGLRQVLYFCVPCGQITGIPVYLHWTLLFIAYSVWHTHGGIEAIQYASIFFAVLLHELGHCYVGRMYGFKIKHITLCPIGGLAAIEFGIPEPKPEFLMAAAGPLTSLGLAALTFVPWYIFQDVPLGTPIGRFLYINMMLFGFNLLPGFPLDGGRILRSVLNWRWGDVLRATRVAANVGLLVAVSFWLVGVLFPMTSLCLIAPMIALLAQGEYRYLVRQVEERDEARRKVIRACQETGQAMSHLAACFKTDLEKQAG